jgi:putative membrane protein
MAKLTRPAAVDWILRNCSRPAIAVVVVTVAAVATLVTAAVEAEGSSPWARAGLDLVLVASGFVLWIPVSPQLPATDRPSALGRAGYLIVQSVVPSFLAIVWIFARHPLYPHFANGARIFGVSPLLDQQLAGFVAKFATIGVLWTVAFVGLTRAQHAVSIGRDPDPLLWSDVQRHLERVERRERRRAWLPPRVDEVGLRDNEDPERQWRPEDRA